MKKILFLILLAGMLTATPLAAAEQPTDGFRARFRERITAHREQQREKNQNFRQKLKNLKPQERLQAIRAHREDLFRQNREFARSMHQERLEHLKQRLAQNDWLTESQRAEALRLAEEMFQKRLRFQEERHRQEMEFMQQLEGMPAEQRRQAAADYRRRRRSEIQAFRERMRAERRSRMDSLRKAARDKSEK